MFPPAAQAPLSKIIEYGAPIQTHGAGNFQGKEIRLHGSPIENVRMAFPERIFCIWDAISNSVKKFSCGKTRLLRRTSEMHDIFSAHLLLLVHYVQ